MNVSLKLLRDQVMVITGASSGIGLATARAAVEQGAQVVMAARGGNTLAELEHELRHAGGEVIAVEADVGRREDVQRIADAAITHFGGFDTWVNNAGVSIWGPLQETREEDSRRMFETNFWGVVYGSLIAVEHLKQRGGTLINVGSVASEWAIPIQGMYSASKHAVQGFTDALRIELEAEGAPVSVTQIKPTSINTPLPQHAKSYVGPDPQLPAPVYAPEEVAHAILHAATHPRRDIYVGGGGKALSLLHKYAPRIADWIGLHVVMPQEIGDRSTIPHRDGLHQSAGDGRIRGEHPGWVRQTSYYTRGSLNPLLAASLLTAAGLLAIRLFNAKLTSGGRR